MEQWVVQAFNEWRKHHGFPTEKNIVDLSKEANVKPLINMLMFFFLEVKKQDGSL